jgi:hypothetical protein
MAASQKSKSDVSQLAGVVNLRVGAFNMGIHQAMLATKAWSRHERRFLGLMIEALGGHGLHLFSCCEVGGHLQGPKHAGAQLQRPIDELDFGWEVVCEQNYVNIFHNAKAFDKPPRWRNDDDANLTLKRNPEIYAMHCSKNVPQLVISEFAVHKLPTKPQTGEGTLVVGSLHIRTPSGTKVTVAEKIRTTKLAKLKIQQYVGQRCLEQSVQILLGDFNLTAEQTRVICQGVKDVSGYDTDWHPQAATAGLGGDVMLISGSDSTVFDIPIGRSYDDRGMRHDNHDAFGVEVQVPLLFGDVTQLAEKASASNSAKASAEKPRPSCNRTQLAEEASASRSATANAVEPVCKKAKATERIANAEEPIANAEEPSSPRVFGK